MSRFRISRGAAAPKTPESTSPSECTVSTLAGACAPSCQVTIPDMSQSAKCAFMYGKKRG